MLAFSEFFKVLGEGSPSIFEIGPNPLFSAAPIVLAAFSAEFDRLQEKLVPLWKSIERFNQDPQTIVVVPSMSIDAIDSGAVIQAYEERFLFLLLLLRQPRADQLSQTLRLMCSLVHLLIQEFTPSARNAEMKHSCPCELLLTRQLTRQARL